MFAGHLSLMFIGQLYACLLEVSDMSLLDGCNTEHYEMIVMHVHAMVIKYVYWIYWRVIYMFIRSLKHVFN